MTFKFSLIQNFKIGHVLAFAFLLRILIPLISLILVSDYHIFHSPDSGTYLTPAKEIIQTGNFYSNGTPEIRRTPGYSLLLIPGIIFGSLEITTIFLQVILSCVSIYLIYQIALLLFETPLIAKISALALSIEPLSIIFCSYLLSETLFTTLITAFLYFIIRYLNASQSRLSLFCAAIFLVCAIYVRPVAIFLPVVIFISLCLLGLTGDKKNTLFLLHGTSFLLICLTLIFPWYLRNDSKANYFGFSSISSYQLYFYYGAAIKNSVSGEPFEKIRKDMGRGDFKKFLEQNTGQLDWSHSQQLAFMKTRGIELILSNKIRALKIYVNGMFRTLIDPGAIYYLKVLNLHQSGGLLEKILSEGLLNTIWHLAKEKPLVFFANLVFAFMLGLFYFFGFLGIRNSNIFNPALIIIIVVMVYFILISSGPYSLARFRHPIMPFLSLFSGMGVYSAFNNSFNKKSNLLRKN